MKPDARRRPLLRWRRRPTAAPHNRCSRVSPPSSLSPLSLLPLLPIPPPLVVAPSVRWRDAPPRCWLRFPRRGSVSLAALSSSLHLPSPPTASGPTLDLAGGPGGADLSLRTVATDVPRQFQCWSRRLGANLRFGLTGPAVPVSSSTSSPLASSICSDSGAGTASSRIFGGSTRLPGQPWRSFGAGASGRPRRGPDRGRDRRCYRWVVFLVVCRHPSMSPPSFALLSPWAPRNPRSARVGPGGVGVLFSGTVTTTTTFFSIFAHSPPT